MKRRRFLSSSIITALGLSSASVINAHHSSKSKKNTYTLSREIKSEKGYDLVVAGGGLAGSAAVKVQGSIRVQPACSMMGQAAGTAVVQFIETGQKANNLDTEQLVKTLRNDGAVLPQETLSRTMTRS